MTTYIFKNSDNKHVAVVADSEFEALTRLREVNSDKTWTIHNKVSERNRIGYIY